MKYVKSGVFTTEQLSIDETITETCDVVAIAMDVIKNISNVSADVQKELNLAITNLTNAQENLEHIRCKTETALKFVPSDIQNKEFL